MYSTGSTSSSEQALRTRGRVDHLERTIQNLNHHEYHQLMEHMLLNLAREVSDDQWETAMADALKKVF